MAKRNPPVPANFDVQLAALLARTKDEGWDKKFSIDVKSMETSLKAHHLAKAKDSELRQTFDQHHKGFSIDRNALYRQFMETLSLLRAAHMNQPEVLKSLEVYKRKGGGSRRKKEPSQP